MTRCVLPLVFTIVAVFPMLTVRADEPWRPLQETLVMPGVGR